MMSYAKKVGDDFVRLNTTSDVEAYVSTKIPGQHSIRTIKRWSEEYRNGIDLYTIQSATLGAFERKTDGLVPSDGVVTEGKEDMPLSVAKGALRERVAAKRWLIEISGFSFTPTGGSAVTILTDRDSQSKFAGLFNLAGLAADDFTVAWKHSTGFVVLSKSDAIRMTVEAGQHIQGAFGREATLSASIENASTLTALSAIDIESGW
jgi:hypothetical protein